VACSCGAGRGRRDYSHGCIRLEKPVDLAQWVLDGTGWTPERIRAAMDAGQERYVALPRPVPVYITYFTVWVDDEGRALFRPDVYRHDAAQDPLLPAPDRPAPSPQVAASAMAAAGLSF
jgi:murein L,D-transpeptidase YcbB/YkuD